MSDKNRDDMKTMTLGEHLDELRRRVLYALCGLVAALVAAAAFANNLIDALKNSYAVAMRDAGLEASLNVPALSAGFATYCDVALAAGLVLASPWIFYQLWAFVSAGLYRKERRYVMVAAPFSAGLFIAGVLFFLLVVAHPVMAFFVDFNRWMGVRPVIMLQDHIAFVTHMMLLFGLAFQTPIIVVLLVWMGAVSLKTLSRYRKHVIVAILIIAAVLTPPDVASQIAMAVPMWLLYELGVLLAWLLLRRRTKFAE